MAIDTNPEFLEFIKNSTKGKGLDSIKAVINTEDNATLPEKRIDLIFMRNVCHRLPNRVEYFRELKSVLKPKGKVAIIDYRTSVHSSFHRMFGDYVPDKVGLLRKKRFSRQVYITNGATRVVENWKQLLE